LAGYTIDTLESSFRKRQVFDNIPGSIGHIKTGKVRALGVTAPKRVAAIPDVPTIGETVPGSPPYHVRKLDGLQPGQPRAREGAAGSPIDGRGEYLTFCPRRRWRRSPRAGGANEVRRFG